MNTLSDTPTTRVLIWDLPTRVLHWLLATSFAGAFGVAVLVSRRNPAFPLHMLLGAIAALVVVLRAVWGFVGSRYARFRSFAFGPRDVIAYLRGLFTSGSEGHVGHNPANGWAAFAMLASTAGTAITGALMPVGGRMMRQIHPVFAYGTVALVVVHLLGIVLHTVRRRENVALGMLDGKKAAPPAMAIPRAYPIVALVFVLLIGATAGGLVESYDASNRTLTIPGLGQLAIGGKRKPDASPRAPAPPRANEG